MRNDLDLNSYLEPSNSNEDKNKHLVTLSTDRIKTNPQARKEFKNIARLAQTIEKEGQLQRIIITPADDEGNHTIIAGERRWRACKSLGIDIDCVIKDTDNPHAIQIIENIEREDLTYIETAEHLKVMQEYYQVSLSELADMISRDISYISRHLKIANSENKFKDLLKQAKVKSISAADDLEKIYTKNPKTAKRIVDKGLTRDLLTRTLNNLKKGKSTRINKPEKKPLTPIIGFNNEGSIEEVSIIEDGKIILPNGDIKNINFDNLMVIGAK